MSFIKLTVIGILMLALNACAVYPAQYGGYYPRSVVRESRVVIGGGYYRPPPRVFVERNFYGYGHPQHFQRFYGPGFGHGHNYGGGYGGHHDHHRFH